MKATLLILAKVAALTVLYVIFFAAVSGALLAPTAGEPSEPPAGAASALLVISLLTTTVLSYIILHSHWGGWRLILAIFIVLYGVTTVMPQIETAFFVTRLPPGMLSRLFLAGAIIAAIFSPLAVLILGKIRDNQRAEGDSRLNMPLSELLVKLLLIAIVYVVLYFTFGYFIAWQNAAVRAYYGGSDPGNLFAQMQSVFRETPLLVPLQILRGIMWAGLAMLVIRLMKAHWWKKALAVALLFSVVMTSPLLLPNPLMPEEVRLIHLAETASSNFLFGWLAVLILLVWRMPTRRAIPA